MGKNSLIVFLITLTALFTQACGGGGGGGGGDNDNTPTWNGPRNSSGYPAVNGSYSFTTKSISWSCTDGSSGSSSAVSINLSVALSTNTLTLTNLTFVGDIPGITIISNTGLIGNVELNASFITTQILTATIDGLEGNVTLTYNISGNFTTSGWSGNYSYTALSQAGLLPTCTYTSTFSGNKLSKPISKSEGYNNLYGEDALGHLAGAAYIFK